MEPGALLFLSFSFYLLSSSLVRIASLRKLSFRIRKPNPDSPKIKCLNTPFKGHTRTLLLEPRTLLLSISVSVRVLRGNKCSPAKWNDWISITTISVTFAVTGKLYGEVLPCIWQWSARHCRIVQIANKKKSE